MSVSLVLALAAAMGVGPPGGPAPAADRGAHRDAVVQDIVFALAGPWPQVDTAPLQGALEAALSSGPVAVRVVRRPEPGNIFDQIAWARGEQVPGRAVFWLVARGQDGADLYVIPPGQELGYVRELTLIGDAVERNESLAVVVHAIVDALDRGPPAGMSEVEASREGPPEGVPDPEPSPIPSPDPEPSTLRSEPDVHPGVAVLYRGASMSDGAPWQNGVGGAFDLVLPLGFTVAASAGWMRGFSDHPTLSLKLDRLPVDFAVGWRARRRRAIAIDLALAVSTERLAWRTERSDNPALGDLDGRRWRLGLGLDVGLRWRATGGLEVGVSVGMRGWLRDASLAVETDEGLVTILEPHPVSVDLRAGVGYRF